MAQLNWFAPGKGLQLAITCTCLQAFVLFGYDQGVFSGIITNPDFLETFNHPKDSFIGIIVSIYNIGCFLGCILNFFVGNYLGRRKVMWLAMFLICVGAILQTAASSVPPLMVGRVITGFGTGLDTSTVPMYQSELCEPGKRGRLVTTEVLFTALGIVFAYFFDYGMSFVPGSIAWRLPIAFQMIFAFIVVVLVFALPDSPRWLMASGRIDEGVNVLCQVYNRTPDDAYIESEKTDILNAIALEKESQFKWRSIFKPDVMHTGKRVALSCGVLFMNQLCGINVAVFYAPTVLQTNMGLDRNTSLVVGGCVNLGFAVGSLYPSFYLDKHGRKKPMMFGSIALGLSMMMIAVLLSFKGSKDEKAYATAGIAFFFIYMLCFGASLNGIPWCYSTEILPLSIRAPGTALAVSTNWIWTFLVVTITPVMVNRIAWKTYLLFMCLNFVFAPVIYFFYPETKGLSLEEIDYIFVKRESVVLEGGAYSEDMDKRVHEKTANVEHAN